MSTNLIHFDKADTGSNDSLRARSLTCFFSAALCTSLPMSAALAADAPTGGKPDTRAFILSNTYIPATEAPNDCPALTPGAPEVFLHSLPPEQQKNFDSPDKHEPLFALMHEKLGFKWFRMLPRSVAKSTEVKRAGYQILPVDNDPASINIDDVRTQTGIPDGKGAIVFNHTVVAYDSCTNPEDFPMLNRGFQPFGGKVAFGMNLDNKGGRNNFTNPSGDKNVDNQLWRVLGCSKQFREFGNRKNIENVLDSAAAPTLIEISGIDNEHNDNHVEVRIYASADPLLTDSRGRALANSTYSAVPKPALTAHARGRIVDSVLITEPTDIHLRYKEQIVDNVRELRGARIRATLKPDGSIEGGFFGYYTIKSFYDSIRQMTQLGANLSSISCATIYNAVHQYADGYPDPQTGRNTAISSALSFNGVPAFVVKPADKSTVVNTH